MSTRIRLRGRRSTGRRLPWLGSAVVVVAVAIVAAFVEPGDAQTSPPASAAPPSAAQTAAPTIDKPAQIDRNGVLILIRSTLLAVDHANKTGNYTVLKDLGAPGFQAGNTAARLTDIFANLRGQSFDLSGVAVLDPQLTTLPTIGQNGMMRMAGFFPSVPLQINFELLFAPVEGRWRLYGIGLNVGQAAPVAPTTPPVQPQATDMPEKPKSPISPRAAPR